MASTASTVLRMELMAPGENDGTWGQKTNTNFQIMESALTGTAAINTTGGTTTLTNVDYTNDQAKRLVLDVTGTLVSNATIVIPNATKNYKVLNRTTGAFTLTIKTASGSGIVITQATGAEIYCDGANVVRFLSPLVDFTTGAPATASGAAASAVSVTPTGNLGSSNAQAALAELQGDIDSINANFANYQPLDADLTTIGGLAKTDSNFIVGNGTAWTVESGDTARTSLGLGTGNAVSFNRLTINGASGIEGGEMEMARPASGTTLAGNVLIDINGNSLRIFEGGGSFRGAVLDLTLQASQSEILTSRSNGLANATGLPIVGGTTGTLSVARGGTGTTTSTGSGSTVLSNSPTFTGAPLGPTAAASDTGTHLANCAFVWSTLGAPSGTTLLAHQNVAPLGWTKITTWDNRALRLVNGTVTAGGSSAFTSVFTNRTISEANLPSHSHTFSGTTSGQSADHTHGTTFRRAQCDDTNEQNVLTSDASGEIADATMTSGGTSNDHTHNYSGTTSAVGSGVAMDFAVQYVDVIMIQKS